MTTMHHTKLATLLYFLIIEQRIAALLFARPLSSPTRKQTSFPGPFPFSSSNRSIPQFHRIHVESVRTEQRIFLSKNENDLSNPVEDNDLVVKQDANQIATSSKNPEEILSKERRDNLFQFLLRDLQVEGVPLLAVDADQIHTMQAAIWTTLAELWASTSPQSAMSEQLEKDDGVPKKACLIFEEIPVETLRTFVDDFRILQTQDRLMSVLPELSQIQLSMVGNGVGPAILVRLDCKNIKASSKETSSSVETNPIYNMDPNQAIAAMKMFVDRVVHEIPAGPHNLETGAENLSSSSYPVQYRVCVFSDACHILSSFWNCICELQATRPDQISNFLLLLPALSITMTQASKHQPPSERHDRFAAISELISRSLCLYRGNDAFELIHFDPEYTRNKIFPPNRPAHGHLPHSSSLRPMLEHAGYQDDDNNNPILESEEECVFEKSNYLRRAPMTAVGINRISEMNNPTNQPHPNAREDLVIDDMKIPATTVQSYVQNLLRVANEDEEKLQSDLQNEMNIVYQQQFRKG